MLKLLSLTLTVLSITSSQRNKPKARRLLSDDDMPHIDFSDDKRVSPRPSKEDRNAADKLCSKYFRTATHEQQKKEQTEARELELIEGFEVYRAAIEQMNEGTHIDVIKQYFQECRSRILEDTKISTKFNRFCLRELILRAVQRETGQNGKELHDLFVFTGKRGNNDMRKKLHKRVDVVERVLKLQ